MSPTGYQIDASGNGRSYLPQRQISTLTPGGLVGNYLAEHVPQHLDTDQYGRGANVWAPLANPVPGTTGLSVELLFRPAQTWFRYGRYATVTWGQPAFSVSTFGASVQILLIFHNGLAPNAPGYQSSSKYVGFPMTGDGPTSWGPYTDGGWHHMSIAASLEDGGHAQLMLDGIAHPLHEVALNLAPPAVGAWTLQGVDTMWFAQSGYVPMDWDLDEVAFYNYETPATLRAQHAREALAGGHYTHFDTCDRPACFTLYDETTLDPRDSVPTDDDLPPSSGGTPLQTPLDQLRSAPLPRYKEGSGFDRLESWIDTMYLTWQPGVIDRPSLPQARENALVTEEMSLHWNYFLQAPALLSNTPEYATGDPLSNTPGLAEIMAGLPDVPLATHTFWGAAPNMLSLRNRPVTAALAPYIMPLGWPSPLMDLEPWRDDGRLWASRIDVVASLLGRDFDLIIEDGETAIDSGAVYAPWYTDGDPAASNDYLTRFGNVFPCANPNYYPGTQLPQSNLSTQCEAAARWGTELITRFRQAYAEGLRDGASTGNAEVQFYAVDGSQQFRAGTWQYGARDVASEQPGQGFQPPGTVQKMASPDYYFVSPGIWDSFAGANHGLGWVPLTRGFEIRAGDHLFWPYVSAGFSTDGASDLRPGRYLGLLKALVLAGAQSFHPGVFNTVTRRAGQDANGDPVDLGNWPVPYDGRDYVWQAMTPAYAQAIATRMEAEIRTSELAWDRAHGYDYFDLMAGDPRKLVVARRGLDAEGTPDGRWLLTGSIQPYTNSALSHALRESTAAVTLPGSPLQITLPIRQQGSTYSLDLRDPTAPVLVQQDAWHEAWHPLRWWKAFQFDAEVNDATTPAAGGPALVPRTEGRGVANMDFTGFTTYLAVSGAAPGDFWGMLDAGDAPQARFDFEPRADWSPDWYVWVRARTRGDSPGVVYVNLDAPVGAPGTLTLGCVTSAEWTWVHIDAATGAVGYFGAVAEGLHSLFVAPGDAEVEIDAATLAPAPEDAFCPAAEPCGACVR